MALPELKSELKELDPGDFTACLMGAAVKAHMDKSAPREQQKHLMREYPGLFEMPLAAALYGYDHNFPTSHTVPLYDGVLRTCVGLDEVIERRKLTGLQRELKALDEDTVESTFNAVMDRHMAGPDVADDMIKGLRPYPALAVARSTVWAAMRLNTVPADFLSWASIGATVAIVTLKDIVEVNELESIPTQQND